ncbi:DUF6493 family protein [Streptomyces sp. CAU 1734]|uniref:DUF7824 domain-containing protein n=1 Tax=Streptomyces sp. CAU 1734 TaxID=3140360 RepID=UPI003260DC33
MIDAVRRGAAKEIPGLLEELSPADRKAALAELKTVRAELRDWGWDRWREQIGIRSALLVAGAGCHTGAAAAAGWIGAQGLRTGRHMAHGPLLEVLAGREPRWLADVAHRLAARRSTAAEDYSLIRELVELSGCEVPTTDGYVQGWARTVSRARKDLRELHLDPQAAVLVPRLFEAPESAGELAWLMDPDDPAQWPSVLAGLPGHGVVERAVLVDGCVSRLLRGGRPGDLRVFLTLLRRFAPTPEEERARTADWVGMAADGAAPVAGHAQEVLIRLAERGELPAGTLAEVSGAVLFRTEKKLVRAQLSLLGKVLRVHARAGAGGAEAVGVLLPAVADAFGHPDTGIQERALKLAARYLPAVGEEVRAELAAAAGQLSPGLRAGAAEVFGALLPAEEAGEYEEILPVVTAPRELAPAAESVAELVEDLLVLTGGARRPALFERTLDGLVRWHHRAPTELAGALREALAGAWWLNRSDRPWITYDRSPDGVEIVVAALLGLVPVETLRQADKHSVSANICPHSGLRSVERARLWEAAHRARIAPLPFLLATPTLESGVLDAGVLVERLAEYHRLGIAPRPADFTQALLRVAPDASGAAAVAAAAIGSEEGGRLAAWLTGEGPEMPGLLPDDPDEESGAAPSGEEPAREEEPAGEPSGTGEAGDAREAGRKRSRQRGTITRRLVREARILMGAQRDFPKAFRWLGATDPGRRCSHYCGYWQPQWAVVFPHHREALAHWMTPRRNGSGSDCRETAGCLPVLAEAGAPGEAAGPALHRALAAGMNADRAEDRLAVVDAMLVLAARGQLDPIRLGEGAAKLIRHREVKLNRFTDALRTGAETGAQVTVWSVLAAALPVLLATRPAPAGLGGVLAVAADCAERCGPAVRTAPVAGAGERIPGLAELAARGGSSQTVTQAARLLRAVRP